MIRVYRMHRAFRTALAVYRHAPALARLRAWSSAATRRLEDAEPFVPTEGLILDFDAGDGLFARFLIESSPARRIVAVEPDVRRRALGERLHKEYIARHSLKFFSDLDRLPSATRFDAALILDVLYLIAPQDRKGIMGQVGSYLRPGGILIIKEIVEPLRGIQNAARLQEMLALRSGFTRGACIRFPTDRELRAYANDAGCRPILTQHLPRFHYRHELLVARHAGSGRTR